MHIEHIAMNVRDLEGMRAFYMQAFGATSNDLYHNPRTGLRTYFLSFDSGVRLELMERPVKIARDKSVNAEGYLHLAFSLGSHEAVDSKTQELVAMGCVLLDGPRTTGDGYYESSLSDPEGNLLEVVA